MILMIQIISANLNSRLR